MISRFVSTQEAKSIVSKLYQLSGILIHLSAKEYVLTHTILQETHDQATQCVTSPEAAAHIRALFDCLEATIIEWIPQMASAKAQSMNFGKK